MDENILKYLESRFNAVEEKLDAMQSNTDKMDLRMQQCRTHCDMQSGTVFERLNSLEKQAIAAAAGDVATQNLRKELQQQFDISEDRRVQDAQSFWIKISAVVAATVLLQAILTMAIDRFMR